MKIYKIKMEMPYRYDNKARGDEEKAEVRAFFATLPSCQRQEPEDFEYLVEQGDMGAVMVRFAGAGYDAPRPGAVEMVMDMANPERALSAMLERVELAASRLTSYEERPGFNERAQSPLSGPHLHGMNRLLLLGDCCTDELQSALDKGWRIIAVCPQEQRRPDYVLGRQEYGGGNFGVAARDPD